MEAKSVWSTRLTTAMMAEARRPEAMLIEVSSKRSVKLLHCGVSGHQTQSNPVISAWVIKALRTIR